MIEPVVTNIPVSLFESFRGRTVVVRSPEPAKIVEALGAKDVENVAYVQVLGLRTDLQPLALWSPGAPIDLVVEDPEADLPLLYPCAPLLDRHPVRITVPVAPGFGKVVKLAASLHFAVKLEVTQPDPALVEEMSRVLLSYLHQPMVSEPIEFYHSLFLALFRQEPATLWAIQEEDPARNRFITDDGRETLSPRLAKAGITDDVASLLKRIAARTDDPGGDCSRCEFLGNCSGYFRWPDPEYRCDGVKALFRTLKDAARQLTGDLEAYRAAHGKDPS